MNDKDLYGIFLIAIFFALAFIWLVLNYVIGILEKYNKNKGDYYKLKKSNTIPAKTLFPLSMKINDSVSDGNKKYGDYYLSDYTIFASYNSAAGSTYENDWVDEDILVNMINTGARFLDFEIYSINNKAVIAVNDTESCRETGTFNNLPLDTVLKKISTHAFIGSENDPLFLQFRLKTSNPNVLKQLGDGLTKYFDRRLMPKYTQARKKSDTHINKAKLKEFINKVVILVNDNYCNSNILADSEFYKKYVNMSNRDTTTVSYRSENDIVSEADKKQLIKDAKDKMIIVLPDHMKKGMHISFNQTDYQKKYGIQVVLRNLSYSKENHIEGIKKYMNDFYEHGNKPSAFKLKPKDFRRSQIIIPAVDCNAPGSNCGTKASMTTTAVDTAVKNMQNIQNKLTA